MEEIGMKLKRMNILAGIFHFIQAVAVILLSDPERGLRPISVSYLSFDQVTQSLVPMSKVVGEINLALLVAIFFLLSFGAHMIVSTIYFERYKKDLAKGINKIRWFEYALSASVMMVAISFLSGIYDLSSLIMIFALNAIMNLLGLSMERNNSGKSDVNWFEYLLGCLAGIVPWIVFVIYVVSATKYGGGEIPTFVYWIYVSIFIFFNSFAVNMFLQYKKIGNWKDYIYGEKGYIVLSLVAKSLLAWQVFSGTLMP